MKSKTLVSGKVKSLKVRGLNPPKQPPTIGSTLTCIYKKIEKFTGFLDI